MPHRSRTFGALIGAAVALASAGPAPAATPVNTKALEDAVSVGGDTSGIRQHLKALQEIADNNGGNRSTGTSGHRASADYVIAGLDPAYWNVTKQDFVAEVFQDVLPPTLSAAGGPAWIADTDFATMSFSPSGSFTDAAMTIVDHAIPTSTASTSTSGCETTDFPAATAGTIAVIQRGTCSFAAKALNAQAAGAKAVVIYNEGTTGDAERNGLLNGTLDANSGVTIPVLGTSYPVGLHLVQHPTAPLSLSATTRLDRLPSYNVIATSKAGRADREVLSGAHLDSVPEGPGINDDGSGSATQLELAQAMAKRGYVPRNRVRLIWFSGEEQGLLGSTYYANHLTKTERADILGMLDFDMLASPNYGLFIYDGDGSEFPTSGPNGSGVVEKVFQTFFDSRGVYTERDEFDGRSDYDGFTALGIPAGGINTGAEVHKTDFQKLRWGGTVSAGLDGQYDPCYHLACDSYGIDGTHDNINDTALDIMSDAVANAVGTLAQTTSSTNGTVKSSANAAKDYEYKGDKLIK